MRAMVVRTFVYSSILFVLAALATRHAAVRAACQVPDRGPGAHPSGTHTRTDSAHSADDASKSAGTDWFARRRIHRFDFDERKEGNLEDEPKFWRKLRMKGFPHFSQGGFDFTVGHAARPSFYLKSMGRNIAYLYDGPDTRVRPDAEYRVEGFIRPDRLTFGRACLSAHFTDRTGRPVPGTLVRSRCVGGADEDNEWTGVTLYLPAPPPEAWTVGLTVWVLQEPWWNPEASGPHHVSLTDVHGGAWFDDITVFALPRTGILAGRTVPDARSGGRPLAGRIAFQSDPAEQPEEPPAPNPQLASQELRVILADSEDPTLQASLIITDADGVPIETHDVPVAMDVTGGESGLSSKPDRGPVDNTTWNSVREMPTRVRVDHLPPGYYRAELQVLAEDRLLARDETWFLRLAPQRNRAGASAREFGVVLDPQQETDLTTVLAMLEQQQARAVKLPVFVADTGKTDQPFRTSDRRFQRLMDELAKRGFLITGILVGLPDMPFPSPVAAEAVGGATDSQTAEWASDVASRTAALSSLVHWWQVGRDGALDVSGAPITSDDATRDIAAVLGDAMRRYVRFPRLAMACATAASCPAAEPSTAAFGQVSLSVNSETSLDDLRRSVEGLRHGRRDGRSPDGPESVTVYVEPLPVEAYDRTGRLATWAQRVITARHAGADTVYAPQTWRVRTTLRGTVVEPLETFIVLRTIADLLAGTTPGPSVYLGEGVHACAFTDGDGVTLAAWDDRAPPDGRTHAVQLGAAGEQLDVWGRTTRLKRDAQNRQLIRLSPMPVFIPAADRRLIALRAGLSLVPSTVPAGTDRSQHVIRFDYRGRRPAAGSVRLYGPPGWKITPDHFPIRLAPGDTQTRRVEIAYPHNEPIGERHVEAAIRLKDEADDEMRVLLPHAIRAHQIGLWAQAVVEEDELFVKLMATNRTQEPMRLRASAILPGRQRLHRPIPDLRPGQTQTVTFRAPGGHELIGRRVRLAVRRMDESRQTYTVELRIP